MSLVVVLATAIVMGTRLSQCRFTLRRICALKKLILLLLLCAAPASATIWPTNVVTVGDDALDSACTATDTPYSCCTGSGTGTCTGGAIDGADIAAALETCEASNGCILQLPCNTTIDGEVDLFSAAASSNGGTAAGRDGTGYGASAFSNGLIIQGCGTSTKWRSRVPASDASGPRLSILWMGNNDNLPPGAHLWIRNLELDGRSEYQPAPSEGGGHFNYAVDNEQGDTQYHSAVLLGGTVSAPLGTVWMDNVYVHSFMGTAIMISNTIDAVVRNSIVTKAGCRQDFSNSLCTADNTPAWTYHGSSYTCCDGNNSGTCSTLWKARTPTGEPVDGEIECGCLGSTPATCTGWNQQGEANAQSAASPGEKTQVYGIALTGIGNHLVVNNDVSYTTKYGIVSSSQSDSDPRDTQYTRIHNNTVSHTPVGIIAGTFFGNVVVTNNTLSSIGNLGDITSGIAAIQTNGPGHYFEARNNAIQNSNGSGIGLLHAVAKDNMKPSVRIEGNTISNTGGWLTTDPSALSRGGPIWRYTGIAAPCDATYGPGMVPMNLWLINNIITSDSTGFQALSLEQADDQTCPSTHIDPLVITGGNFVSSGWAAQNLAIGKVLAYNISATNVVLTNNASATNERFTFTSGSTGACSGWTINSDTGVTGVAGVTGSTTNCP